jgi:hypothetical protein
MHLCTRLTCASSSANAITEAYLRKKAYEDARVKGDPIVLWAALRTARGELAKAVEALSEHIKEHGCKK